MSFTLRHLFLSALSVSTVAAQCYWPNGTQTSDTDSTPCTQDRQSEHLNSYSSLAICCPPQWSCTQDGICQNPAADMDIPSAGQGQYGRYGCQNSDWSNCPSVCLDQASTSGAESILQCTNGIYCCDRNRQAGNCCNGEIADNSPMFFNLNNGVVTPQSAASSGAPPSSTTSSPGDFTASGSPATTTSSSVPSSSPATTTNQPSPSVATDASGSVRTIFVTPTAQPNQGGGGSSSNAGIIGGAVGGTVGGLLLIGAIVFLFWRRRVSKRKHQQAIGDDKLDAPSAPFKEEWNESAVSGAVEADSREKAEIDGFPVQKQTKYGELGSKQEHGGSTPIIELPTTER